MKKVSMKEVAKHAGVSIATVSHVINQTRNVSDETREKVEQSIRELHFRPNSVARSFKTGRSNLIAFVIPDIANHFYATLAEEIQNIIGQEGYQLLLVNTGEDPEKESKSIQALENNMVDAIIIASTQPDYASFKGLISGTIPYLFIDRKFTRCPYDSVTVSSYDAICQALEQVIARGHTRIGYINGLERLSSTRERFRAYTDTMKAHHLPCEDYVQTGVIMSLSSSTDPQSLIQLGCTALVCANNVLTIDTFNRLADVGIIPGKDVELIGFQESNATQYELKFIDLIIRPSTMLGRKAGEQIMERLAEPDLPPREIILQAQYRPRSRQELLIP